MIGSRFDEVNLDVGSQVEETSHQIVIKHNPIEVRVYQQQRHPPMDSPLAASRQSPNEIFTSVKRQTLKFEEDMPVQPEVKEIFYKLLN